MDKFFLLILRNALAHASPALLANLRGFVAGQVVEAEKTPNPWDDLAWGVLQLIVGKPGGVTGEIEGE